MNLKELHELAGKLLADGADPKLKVGTRGHYGELETELDTLYVTTLDRRANRGDRLETYVVLGDIPSHYPEPD